jgi:uncharacterized protein YjbI with pentapeptide repeats
MRRRLLALFALLVLGSLVPALPASAASHDARAQKKACVLKKKATCKKAKLSKQKIGKQNLSGSNLSGAVISGSTFTGTNLRNADLSNAKLTDVTFKNTDLSGVNLTGATLVNVRFDHVDASKGSSGRACEIISGSENSGCELPGFRADGSKIHDVYISYSNFAHSSWRDVRFDNAGFVNCTLNDADFTGADFGTGDKRGISGTIGAEAQRARFDNSKHLALFRVIANKSSFLGATDFTEVDSSLEDARGLQGSRTVTVSRTPGFSLAPNLIQIYENGYWRIGNLCLNAITCSYAAAVGSPIRIRVRSAIPFSVSGSGLTCTQFVDSPSLSVTTCDVNTLPAGSDPLAVTFGPYDPSPSPSPAPAPAPVVVTKTVSVSLLDPSLILSAPTIDAIKIQQVTSGGSVTATQTCLNASTCSATFPVGSLVRFSFTDSYNVSPFRWIVLNDGASTTIGPSPFVDQVTPAFALNTDVALTAWLS